MKKTRRGEGMANIRCYCCEKELPEGSLKYIVSVKSFADFDGYLEESVGDVESAMTDLLEGMEDKEQQTLEEDVYHEMAFILCKECRDRFYKKPFNISDEGELEEEIKGVLH